MFCPVTVRRLFRLGIILGSITSAQAQSVSDYAVQVSAMVQPNPASIMLSWPEDPATTSFSVHRKLRDSTSWGPTVTLAADATSYTDTNVMVGGAYEYWLSKGTPTYNGYGYIYAGIQTPLVELRGNVVLVVDSTHAGALAIELGRLEQDLVGDGWTVLRHDVARMAVDPANNSTNVWAARYNELAALKALIVADYQADPTNVKTVFLFGHVPVPYSGDFAQDGHGDHQGAWPADLYYADMDGLWTDSSVTSTYSSDPRNWNYRGDGKFDQSSIPSDVELQVGRADFANMPSFALSEQELLRQYLNKDHNFRQKLITVPGRGLIDDNFGSLDGEAPAGNGWRNFPPFFGAANVVTSADWFPTLNTQAYLWGYGCGAGTFTGASGVGSTADFAANDPRVVFTMLFGSYFGDWDSQDNFMRAALATPTYTLTCSWGGRPNWVYHHMGLGETIGFSARTTQNYSQLYFVTGGSRRCHIALMGDPTLRLNFVAPPSALIVSSNGSGRLDLRWNASPDTVLGYHVYRAPTAAGPFTRLNSDLITNTNYTDLVISSNTYMVRAVKLELSGSGSYYNASQGIFQSLDGSAGAPVIALFQPTNNSTFFAPTNIRLSASFFDPDNGVTNVSFYAGNVRLGDVALPPYTFIWTNAQSGSYALTARAACTTGLVAESTPVSISVGGAVPLLVLRSLGNSSYALSGFGLPNLSYQIQAANIAMTNWQTVGTATANSSGSFQFIDSNSPPQRWYRTAYP